MISSKIRSQENKTMTKARPNLFVIYLLWIIATMVGWWVGTFDLDAEAKTYIEIARLMPIYLADGLLIGFIVGVGQAMILKRLTNLNWTWAFATILGYGLAFFAGLVISVSIPSIIIPLRYGNYLLPFKEPSTVSIWLNIHDIFWGGFLIGGVQWIVLKKTFQIQAGIKPSCGFWQTGLYWAPAFLSPHLRTNALLLVSKWQAWE
jgi:hypothetical protein